MLPATVTVVVVVEPAVLSRYLEVCLSPPGGKRTSTSSPRGILSCLCCCGATMIILYCSVGGTGVQKTRSTVLFLFSTSFVVIAARSTINACSWELPPSRPAAAHSSTINSIYSKTMIRVSGRSWVSLLLYSYLYLVWGD